MKKPHGKIDWIVAENDEAWQATQAQTQLERYPATGLATSFLHKKELVLATLLATLLLLLIGGWLWPHSTAIKGTIQKLPPTTAQASVQASAQEEQPLTQTIELLGNSMHVDRIQRIGDRVMAQVLVEYTEAGKGRAFRRETRFYARSANEWQRIPPDLALLGPQKTLKIANFTILYHAADADAVYKAAPKLEQLYATLRHDFGQPTVVPTVAYTIEVASSSIVGANFYDYSQRKLTISSPLLLSAPVEITPATVVEQLTAYPLAHLLIHEAIYQHDARWQYNFSHWYPLEDALSLWELWQKGGPLASDRAALITWLYQRSQNPSSRLPLPAGYTQLCGTHRIWQLIPPDLSIPLARSAQETASAPSNDYPALTSTWPHQTDYRRQGAYLSQSGDAAPIALETIIEYIVATYGRDKLPQLLAALGEHITPATLIPALFGISQADFEAGWQAYLAKHY